MRTFNYPSPKQIEQARQKQTLSCWHCRYENTASHLRQDVYCYKCKRMLPIELYYENVGTAERPSWGRPFWDGGVGMKKVYRVTLPSDWEGSDGLVETAALAVDHIRANVCDTDADSLSDGDEFTISVMLVTEAEWAQYLVETESE